VTLLLGRRMAKMGRPRKDEGDRGTELVRVFADLAEKLADLAEVLDTTTAQICDPLLRHDIEAKHAKYKPQIDEVKAARKRADEEIRNAREAARKLAESQPKRKGRQES
jgi:vacuolar-type H+-ATPase subunit I/STV1